MALTKKQLATGGAGRICKIIQDAGIELPSAKDWSDLQDKIRDVFLDRLNAGEKEGYKKGRGPLEFGQAYYDDGDAFPFGKHKGKPFIEVPKGYLEWVMRQPWCDQWPGVVRYFNGEEPLPDQELEGARTLDDEEAPF